MARKKTDFPAQVNFKSACAQLETQSSKRSTKIVEEKRDGNELVRKNNELDENQKQSFPPRT